MYDKSNHTPLFFRFAVVFMALIFIVFGIVYASSKLFSGGENIKPTKIAGDVTDFSVSGDGDFAYVENKTLHIVLSDEEKELTVGNFNLTDIALSRQGSYFSAKNESSCEIWSLPDMKVLKNETCMSEISWADDNSYVFFEGSAQESSDFIDESAGTLITVSLNTGVRKPNLEISPNSTILFGWGSKSYVSFASFIEDRTSLCELSPEDVSILSNCQELDVAVSAIRVSDGAAYVSAWKDGRDLIYKISNDMLLPINASINLGRSEFFGDSLFIFDESNPKVTKTVDLLDKNAKSFEISLNRFHSISEVRGVSDSKYLVLAQNGLWEVELR